MRSGLSKINCRACLSSNLVNRKQTGCTSHFRGTYNPFRGHADFAFSFDPEQGCASRWSASLRFIVVGFPPDNRGRQNYPSSASPVGYSTSIRVAPSRAKMSQEFYKKARRKPRKSHIRNQLAQGVNSGSCLFSEFAAGKTRAGSSSALGAFLVGEESASRENTANTVRQRIKAEGGMPKNR
jgi:hypothetical protein